MVKKIAFLGFVSGFALFLYGRKLMRPAVPADTADAAIRIPDEA